MEIVSRYVREQQRYTKNNLKSIFSMDESAVEHFIKNLKAFGVLKSVKISSKRRLSLCLYLCRNYYMWFKGD